MWRIHDHQLVRGIWKARCEGPRDHPAPVVSDDDGLVLPQGVNESQYVRCERLDIVAGLRFFGEVVASHIGSNDTEPRGEHGYLMSPRVPELRKAMQENNQRTFARLDPMEADAVDDGFFMLPATMYIARHGPSVGSFLLPSDSTS